MHEVAGVLGTERQDRTGADGGEVAQAGDAGGDGDGDVEGQHGLVALGLAAADATGLVAPQRVVSHCCSRGRSSSSAGVRVAKPFMAAARIRRAAGGG